MYYYNFKASIIWFAFISFSPLDISCRQTYEELCIKFNIGMESVPKDNNMYNCPLGKWMFITNTSLSEDTCDDVDDDLTPTARHDRGQSFEMILKQACNGRRKCYFGKGFGEMDVYKSFVIRFQCLPAETDNNNKDGSALDGMKNINQRIENGSYFLVIKSDQHFRRGCQIDSHTKESYIQFRPLWITLTEDALYFKACLRVFKGNSTSFSFGCNDNLFDIPFTAAIRSFRQRMDFQVFGEPEAVVWLKLSVNDASVIRCQPLVEDYLHTQIYPPFYSTTSSTTTRVKKKNSTSIPDLSKLNVTSIVTGIADSDDRKLQIIIAVTTSLAVVASCIALALFIYIVYIRKNSAFQRKRTIKRLERATDGSSRSNQQQRYEEAFVQGQRGRGKMPPPLANNKPTFSEYTYVDGHDFMENKTSQLPFNIDQRKRPVPSPSTSSYNGDSFSYNTGQDYSTSYTFVDVETTAGEYNKLGQDLNKKIKAKGILYDTVSTPDGSYSHFDDVITKQNKIIGNHYHG